MISEEIKKAIRDNSAQAKLDSENEPLHKTSAYLAEQARLAERMTERAKFRK